MKILITGGAGFIGTGLTLKCLEHGFDVCVVDKDEEACSRLRKAIEDEIKGNIKEYVHPGIMEMDMVCNYSIEQFKIWKPEVIIHLAAIPRVPYSVEHPTETTEENVYKTVRLLEFAKDNGVKRFVFASSSSVYGGAENLPTNENEPLNPKSPYALQKAQGEQWMKMFSELYGLDTICLRFFNVFGAYQLGNSAYSTAISAWCDKIKNNKPLRLDGPGTQSRDMCHIDNTVQACILAATSDRKFSGDAYNVACGEKYSLNETLDYLRERFSFEVEHAPFRVGDVMHTKADISKIQNDLGYNPSVKFWDGLESTLEWWQLSPVQSDATQ